MWSGAQQPRVKPGRWTGRMLESREIHWDSTPRVPSILRGSSQPSRNRFGVGSREDCGGAKQAQGWVPTSSVSPGGGWGWVYADSRGRRRGGSGGHSVGDLLNFRLHQLGPGYPLGTPPSQATPALASARADPYTFCPTCRPQAPAGPHQPYQARVEGLALFTAAASSSFQ